MPLNTWGNKKLDPWHPHEDSFGKTATEAWIRFLNMRPDNDRWYELQTRWIDRGYCVKEATLEIKI